MAQHDYVIANGTGAAVRSDLNNALAAIVSQNSGATEPATMYAYQWWADTTTGLLKLRNAANNAWITLRELDGTLTIEAGTVSAPGLAFASDLNTGVWSPGADQFAIATNGVERVEWGTSEVVFNDGGTNYDFRIEGDTNANLFFVDASAEAVAIGSTAPTNKLVVASSGVGYEIDQSSIGNTNLLLSYDRAASAYRAVANYYGGTYSWIDSGAERARIDSSGRLLVGTSSARGNFKIGATLYDAAQQLEAGSQGFQSFVGGSPSAAGPYLMLAHQRSGTVGGNTVLVSGDEMGTVSFHGGDGTNLVIGAAIKGEVDGTPGANDMPGRLVFSTTADGASSPTERYRIAQNGASIWYNTTLVYPNTDNAVQLGGGTNRLTAVFAVNGTIQTSDQREKTEITGASLGSDFIKALRPVSYKWIEGGNQDTGKRDENGNYIYEPVPGQRTHWGFIAQEVKQAVDASGVDFGGWVLTDKDNPDSQQALRYDQFIAPLTKALQETMAELEVLKAEVAALKAA